METVSTLFKKIKHSSVSNHVGISFKTKHCCKTPNTRIENNSRVSARLSFSNCIRVDLMRTLNKLALLGLSLGLFACSTPPSKFGVYQQSDGTVGVHSPKDAKESEAQGMALAECQKMGKRTASIVESRKTVNDRFPYTYIYVCR